MAVLKNHNFPFRLNPKILARNITHIQTNKMDSPTKEIITSATDNPKTVSKRGAGAQSKIKNGRVEKSKMNGNQSRNRDISVKKAVNNYILFRCKRNPLPILFSFLPNRKSHDEPHLSQLDTSRSIAVHSRHVGPRAAQDNIRLDGSSLDFHSRQLQIPRSPTVSCRRWHHHLYHWTRRLA